MPPVPPCCHRGAGPGRRAVAVGDARGSSCLAGRCSRRLCLSAGLLVTCLLLMVAAVVLGACCEWGRGGSEAWGQGRGHGVGAPGGCQAVCVSVGRPALSAPGWPTSLSHPAHLPQPSSPFLLPLPCPSLPPPRFPGSPIPSHLAGTPPFPHTRPCPASHLTPSPPQTGRRPASCGTRPWSRRPSAAASRRRRGRGSRAWSRRAGSWRRRARSCSERGERATAACWSWAGRRPSWHASRGPWPAPRGSCRTCRGASRPASVRPAACAPAWTQVGPRGGGHGAARPGAGERLSGAPVPRLLPPGLAALPRQVPLRLRREEELAAEPRRLRGESLPAAAARRAAGVGAAGTGGAALGRGRPRCPQPPAPCPPCCSATPALPSVGQALTASLPQPFLLQGSVKYWVKQRTENPARMEDRYGK